MPAQNKASGFWRGNPSTGDKLSCLEPKQLSFYVSTFLSASVTEDARASPTSAQNDQQGCSPLDSKQQEMKDSITVLQVQIVTAKETLQKLNQLENEYLTLSSPRGCVCNNGHATGRGEGKAKRLSPPLCLPFPRYFSPNREPVHRLFNWPYEDNMSQSSLFKY